MNVTDAISKSVEALNDALNILFDDLNKYNDVCFYKKLLTDFRHGSYMSFELIRFMGSMKNQKVSDNPSEKQLFIRMDGLLSEVDKKLLLDQEEKCNESPNSIKVQVKDIEATQLLMEKVDAIDCSTLGSYIEAGEISRQLIDLSMMDEPQDSKGILEFIATYPIHQLEDNNISNSPLPEILKSDCLDSIAKFEIYF